MPLPPITRRLCHMLLAPVQLAQWKNSRKSRRKKLLPVNCHMCGVPLFDSGLHSVGVARRQPDTVFATMGQGRASAASPAQAVQADKLGGLGLAGEHLVRSSALRTVHACASRLDQD
eukprot:4496144-Amphidinium_carterae.1